MSLILNSCEPDEPSHSKLALWWSTLTMSHTTICQNVYFLNRENNEILGFWQNRSVSWSQITKWMHIVIILSFTQYAVFRCLKSGNPENSATNHGLSINLLCNSNAIDSGYYVVFSANGKYRNSDLLPNLLRVALIRLCIDTWLESNSRELTSTQHSDHAGLLDIVSLCI